MTYKNFFKCVPFIATLALFVPFLMLFFDNETSIVIFPCFILFLVLTILWVVHQIRTNADLEKKAFYLYFVGLTFLVLSNGILWGLGKVINQPWIFTFFLVGLVVSIIIFLLVDLPLIIAGLVKKRGSRKALITVLFFNLASTICGALVFLFIATFNLNGLMMG